MDKKNFFPAKKYKDMKRKMDISFKYGEEKKRKKKKK